MVRVVSKTTDTEPSEQIFEQNFSDEPKTIIQASVDFKTRIVFTLMRTMTDSGDYH